MPAKSKKQYNLMQAVAHGAKVKDGPSESVAREFVDATPAKKRKQFAGRGHGSRVVRED